MALAIGRKGIEVNLFVLHLMGEEEVNGRLDHAGTAAEIDLMIPPMAAGRHAGQQAAGPAGSSRMWKTRVPSARGGVAME